MATETDARALGFVTPSGGDPIKDADDAIRTNAVAAAEQSRQLRELIAAKAAPPPWARGIIPDGTDVNTLRDPGVYVVPTTVVAGTVVNWPAKSPARAGTLTVAKSDGASVTTQDVIVHVSNTGAVERYTRSTLDGTGTTWSPWSLAGWVKGTLNGSSTARVNVDTYRQAGAWVVSARTYVDGLPGTGQGVLEVIVTPSSGSSLQRFTERVANDNLRVWLRYSVSTGGWAGVAWDELGATPPPPVTADVAVSDHATRVEVARARRGGGTGTGGAAVVMLRFDHWLVAFRDKVLPILRAHQLPSTLNVNLDNLGIVANGSGAITWAHVQDWNQYDGVEIANHGATHTDANTRAAIYHEVVEARRGLEAAMPRVAVETWHEHGSAYLTATDLPGDPGLNLGRTPSSFTESYAGRLVMAEHAVVEGKHGGFYVPLRGAPVVGQSHYSVDRSTAADAIALVETAKAMGRGLTLYLHPGLLDTSDETATYMTSAAFTELCAYLVAERDAGRVMVMTAAGGAFADSAHARRENLLTRADFAAGYATWWSGTAGWTFTNPGPNVQAASTAGASTLTQTLLLHSRLGWAMGAAHELVVRAKAGAATQLTLRIEKVADAATWSTERVFAIPGDGVERDYRLNVSLPRDVAITQLAVKITGPSLTLTRPPLLAAI